MLIVWALLLCIASISDAASPRRLQSARHFSAPRPPLLAGHAQQTRLPHSRNSSTRIGARPSTSVRSLKGSGSPRSSPNLLTAGSTKKKKKKSHLYFLRLQPNKAVPAVSTTTPKPTEAPIFIIKSTPHPGEPPVFIVKPTASPKPPASWPSNQRPSSSKPGQHRPTMSRPRPPASPTPSSKPQSVHYHWHQHGPTPIVPQGAIKYIVKTKTTYPRVRPPQTVRAPPQPVRPLPQRVVVRPKPQPIKQPLHVHHMHQHLHHHLVPATQIIIRKRPQDTPPPPRRRPWSFF